MSETNEKKLSFAAAFFRLYDRKVASGEITFNDIGMDKTLFTRLCQGHEVHMTREEVEALCKNMKLQEEEAKLLLATCE